MNIDDIDTINIDMPSATVTGAEVDIRPITNLSFNGGMASGIDVSTMQIPTNVFSMGGLSYNAFDISHLGLPDGTIGNATISELKPNGDLTIPVIEIRNMHIPSVTVSTVNSTSPIHVENAESDIVPPIPFDLGILVLTIRVTPTIAFNVQRLEMAGMQANSSIDKITLQNMTSPVTVRDVSVDGSSLEQPNVNQVSL